MGQNESCHRAQGAVAPPSLPQEVVSPPVSTIDERSALDKHKPKHPKKKKVAEQSKRKTTPGKDEIITDKVVVDPPAMADHSYSKIKPNMRHGSWDYVPAKPRVAYPKATGNRELARLAMDVVDSPHDLYKPPEVWYEGSEFDPNKPISMADRIKLNRRPREPSSIKPTIVKAKDKKVVKSKKKLQSKSPKHEAAVPSPVYDAVGDSDVSLSSNYSEELAMLSPESSNDAKTNLPVMNASSLSYENEPLSLTHSYSLEHSTSSALLTELPDDILEPEQDSDAQTPSSAPNARSSMCKSYLSVVERRLPSREELADLETNCDSGVLFKPRVLCVHPITTNIDMKQLMEGLAIEDLYVVPAHRPSASQDGHAVLIFRDEHTAASMLQTRREIVVGNKNFGLKQPCAILVRVSNYESVTEELLCNMIVSTIGPILHMAMLASDALVILPSIVKAQELVSQRTAGDLIISSLGHGQCEGTTFDWPLIDMEWAQELGMKV